MGIIECLVRGSPDYEQARLNSVWAQLKPARYPDRIARPRQIAEVAQIVREARRNRQTIAVRGSGHNYFASFLRDGGVLLDMSAFTAVKAGAIAHVQPGIQSAPLAKALAERGRAFPTGHDGDVGIGGFLLGGGMGWNGEYWGQFACFRIRAVEVITASGAELSASADSHSDLFWAARGGGLFFPAVVTGFQLETFPLPEAILSSEYLYPVSFARELATWLSGLAQTAGENLEYFMTLEAKVEPGPAGSPTRTDFCRVYVLAFAADRAEATAKLRLVARHAPPGWLKRDESVPTSFEGFYSDTLTGPSQRIANDTAWTDRIVEATVLAAEHSVRSPSANNVAVINFRAAPRLPKDAIMPAASGFLTYAAQWEREEDDEANLKWTQELTDALLPFTQGCYLNETDIGRRPERVALCFTAQGRERLRAVRAKYDPEGMFPAPVPL